jgi:PAS domain S-box-containing protein
MPSLIESNRFAAARRAAQIAGVCVSAVGCAVLLGWMFSIDALKSVRPGYASMKANAAASFVLSGVALLAWRENDQKQWRRRLVFGCALIVACVALLTIIEYLSKRNLGIDQLLFHEPAGTPFTYAPGRMGFSAAIIFLLFSLVFMFGDASSRHLRRMSYAMTLAATFLALAATLVYIYHVQIYQGFARLVFMSLHAAIAFLVLGIGVLASRPERGMIRIILSKGPAGFMSRILLPPTFVLPALLGWLELRAQRAQPANVAFDMAFLILAVTFIAFFFVHLTLSWLDRVESRRRESDQRLAQTLQDQLRLVAIVESSNDAIIGTDDRAVITSWNPGAEKLFGYSPAEALGKTMWIIAAPGLENEIQENKKKIEDGHLVHLESRRQRKDGALIDVSIHLSPIRDTTGKYLGISAIYHDIAERKRLEAVVRQSEKMSAVGQLAAGVAHELKNPLSAILGFTELLARHAAEKDASFQPLKTIEREALRCQVLVNDLLTFSRKKAPGLTSEDLRQVVEEALTLVESEARVRDVEIRKELGGPLPPMRMDRQQIQQVLINLCTNAIDAMHQGGLLTVSVKRAGEQAEIRVTDTGTGIPPEVQDHIFEPFFTTKEAGTGTGLGLSIVQEIVQNHHGSIQFKTQMNCGTTFTVTLPITTTA